MDNDTKHDPRAAHAELSELFAEHRGRLCRMIHLRMDRRLQRRIDPSDVIQETFVEAVQRYTEYQQQSAVPPFIWLRYLTGQKLIQLHRMHLGARARDVNREVSLYRGAMPEATSAALAAQLIGKQTSPTQAMARAEQKLRVQQALNNMEELDREVLALRHFEQLTYVEVAEVLGITHDSCYKRYLRALKRLKGVLADVGG